jgi:hypothetical protein
MTQEDRSSSQMSRHESGMTPNRDEWSNSALSGSASRLHSPDSKRRKLSSRGSGNGEKEGSQGSMFFHLMSADRFQKR